MNRRNFLKSSVGVLGVAALPINVFSYDQIKKETIKLNTIHIMTGPFCQFIFEKNGEMFCHDMCDCGCIDKKWKIEEGDTIIAWRPALWGHLKNLKIMAREFKVYDTTTLEKCNLSIRDCEKYPLY